VDPSFECLTYIAQRMQKLVELLEIVETCLLEMATSAVTVSPLLTTVGFGRFFYQIPRLRSVYGFPIMHCI
jgi:hypothetical protein